MAGTTEGGQSARDTNTKRYGPDYYRRIGAIGGRKGTTGGFYANRELAREAGQRGGRKSKRTYTNPQREAKSKMMKQLWADYKLKKD
jgi:general stress protein YciG